MILLAPYPPVVDPDLIGPNLFGWNVGFAIVIVVLVAVVALVSPILALATRIGVQASLIKEALQQSYQNTRPLADLRKTIDHAEVIVAGLHRGRVRLGGG